MTRHTDPESGKSSTSEGVVHGDHSGERTRELRRKFLLGGIATSSFMFTLANRPALAKKDGPTPSAAGSMNPSHPRGDL